MRKLALAAIAVIAAVAYGDGSASKNWSSDPEWIRTRYGAWGGPGVDPRPGPMDAIALKDYAPKSSLIVTETRIEKARYPAIDVHAHVNAKTPEEVTEWVRTMDEVGIQTSVVLTGATGAEFDRLADLYLKPYPTRFQLYCGLETRDMEAPDYPQRAVAELERCYRRGARGVGELSDKGTGFSRDSQLPEAKRLHPDDPRLNAFWDKCGELKMPIIVHVADHPSAWQPLDVYQERTPDYQHFNLHGKDIPSHAQLLAMRDHAVASHPKTTFIACHLGNQGTTWQASRRNWTGTRTCISISRRGITRLAALRGLRPDSCPGIVRASSSGPIWAGRRVCSRRGGDCSRVGTSSCRDGSGGDTTAWSFPHRYWRASIEGTRCGC